MFRYDGNAASVKARSGRRAYAAIGESRIPKSTLNPAAAAKARKKKSETNKSCELNQDRRKAKMKAYAARHDGQQHSFKG